MSTSDTPRDEFGFRTDGVWIGCDFGRPVEAIVADGQRSNGKQLLTDEQAWAMLASLHFAGTAGCWAVRRVDSAMCITFAGSWWSVLHLPGVCVGDQVQCLPQGTSLMIRDASGQPLGTLASPKVSAHSYPHTCPQTGTPVNSGTPTTSSAPGHEYSCPAPDAADTPQTPPSASPAAQPHNRTGGTTSVAPAALSLAIALVQAPRWRSGRGIRGTRRQQFSLQISIVEKL